MLSIFLLSATVRESTVSEVPNTGTAHSNNMFTPMKSAIRSVKYKYAMGEQDIFTSARQTRHKDPNYCVEPTRTEVSVYRRRSRWPSR